MTTATTTDVVINLSDQAILNTPSNPLAEVFKESDTNLDISPKIESEPLVKEAFVTVEGITVDLLEEAVRIHISDSFSKLVSYPDFIQHLKNNVDSLKDVTDKGTIYQLPYGVFYMYASEESIKLSLYYHECVRNINFRGNERRSVVPNIIISQTLTRDKAVRAKWRVADTRYYATNKSLLELPRQFISSSIDGISLLPFTNVYSDARLCYGDNVRVSEITLPDMRPLNWYYEILFTAPFNNDLGIYALKSGKFKDSPAMWFEHLSTRASDGRSFPYENLSALG